MIPFGAAHTNVAYIWEYPPGWMFARLRYIQVVNQRWSEEATSYYGLNSTISKNQMASTWLSLSRMYASVRFYKPYCGLLILYISGKRTIMNVLVFLSGVLFLSHVFRPILVLRLLYPFLYSWFTYKAPSLSPRPGANNASYNKIIAGVHSVDIDECASAGRCHSSAVCVNTPGSYSCTCKAPFSLGANGTCTIEDSGNCLPISWFTAKCERLKLPLHVGSVLDQGIPRIQWKKSRHFLQAMNTFQIFRLRRTEVCFVWKDSCCMKTNILTVSCSSVVSGVTSLSKIPGKCTKVHHFVQWIISSEISENIANLTKSSSVMFLWYIHLQYELK